MNAFQRWSFRVILVWLALSSLPAAAHIDKVDIASLQAGQSVMHRMHILRESAGQPLEHEVARLARNWQPVEWQHLTSPLQPETIWLAAELLNADRKPVKRLLTVDDWQLYSVELWLLDPVNGAVQGHMLGGMRQPLAERPGMAMESVFAIELQPGEHVQAMLRIRGSGWRAIDVRVWEVAAFRIAEHRQQMLHAVLFGSMCALALVLLLFRDWGLMVLAAWLVVALTFEAAILGYVTSYLAPAARAHFPWVIAALAVLRTMCFAAVTCIVSGLSSHRIWRVVYAGLIVALAHVLISFYFVDLVQAQHLSLLGVALVMVLWPLSMLSVKVGGDRYRQVLLVLLSFFWGMAVLRLLHTMHVVRLHALFDHVHGVLIVQILASVGIIGIYVMRQQAQERSLQRSIRMMERGQRAMLERLVAQRTVELEQAVQRAEEANDAKNDFLARVSHDLRTPLTTIGGYAQLMQAEGGEAGRRAGIFRRSAEHMLHMLTDMIDYARGADSEPLRLAPLYAHGFFSGIAQEAEEMAAGHGNRFTLQLDPKLPPVLSMDAQRVRQILINLLSNSAKFTHDGAINLIVESRADAGLPEAAHLVMRVADTGHGMSPEDRVQAFEPYFRGRNAMGMAGTGLGLRIVALWVRRMRGDIQLHSVPGIGTEVTVEIPVLVSTAEGLAAGVLREPEVKNAEAIPDGSMASTVRDSLAAVPPAARAELERLLDMGAVTDIAAWAGALPASMPACEAFANAVQTLADEGRLQDIQRLLHGVASSPG